MALRERAHELDRVAGETRRFAPAAFRGRALSLEVRGVEPEGEAIRDIPLASGRLITHEDMAQSRRVLVVGHRARERLLGAEGRVGSWVRIDGASFQVVGVLARVGTQLSRDGAEIDDQLWVPLSVHVALWPNPWLPVDMLSSILGRAKDRDRIEAAQSEMRRVLADRLGVAADDEEAVPVFSPLDHAEATPDRRAERRHPVDRAHDAPGGRHRHPRDDARLGAGAARGDRRAARARRAPARRAAPVPVGGRRDRRDRWRARRRARHRRCAVPRQRRVSQRHPGARCATSCPCPSSRPQWCCSPCSRWVWWRSPPASCPRGAPRASTRPRPCGSNDAAISSPRLSPAFARTRCASVSPRSASAGAR